MKALRIFLISGAVLVALVILVIILAFTPSVQTWATRRALAQQPDLRGDVGRVAVGLHQVLVTDLRIERAGMILTVPSATIDLPVISAAGKRILVQRAVAKGWILDLTAPTVLKAKAVAAAVGDPLNQLTQLAVIGLGQIQAARVTAPASTVSAEPFEGIFKLLTLSFDLQVDAADLEGDVLFPTQAGQPVGRAHVVITGGQLGAGRTGVFKITSAVALSGPAAPIKEVRSQTLLQVKMDTPRTFESLSGNLEITASGPKFPQGAELKGDLNAHHAGMTEDYSLSVHSVDPGGEKQILDLNGHYPVDSRQLTGTWKLNARDRDLAPFTLGTSLPVFVAVGEGRFGTDNTFQEIHASGNFEATLDKLEAFNPALSAVGLIRLKGDFDGVQQGQILRIARFSAEVAGVKPIVSMVALQAIELHPSTGELKVADPTKDLFRFKLEGLPLAWVQAFVPGFTIRGDDLRGEMVASARNGGLTVHSLSPLRVVGLTVSKEASPLIQSVDLSLDLTADYSPNGWQADVTELSLRTSGQTWATVSAKAGQPAGKDQPLKATGQYQFDLPAALRQPVFSQLGELTKGRASGDFSAVVTTPLQQLAAKIELRDLASSAATQPLPSISVTVRADLLAGGVIKVQAPLLVQQGDRKSDLNFTAEVHSAGTTQTIDAQLESGLLYVEDMQVLAAPFQSRTPSPQRPDSPTAPSPGKSASVSGRNPQPDTLPFWNGLSGQLRLALKKVIYSADVQAADVSGAVKIGGDAITLDHLRAMMGEGSSAAVSGGITFDRKAKEPYALAGDLNVTNLNPGPILAMLSPQHQPTAEGQFDMVGKFNGEASGVATLTDKTSAEIKLTSRGGKFNGFAAGARAADVGKLQKVTSTAATLLGLASGIIGENKVSMYAERVRAISDIFKRFVQIDFDQLNLELAHHPGESTKIKDFSLISPTLRFVGTGAIEDVAGKSWWDQPLHLVLEMAVRGEQANDMKLLGALQEEKDALGYIPLKEKVPIEGTLSDLGTESLTKFVMRYAPK